MPWDLKLPDGTRQSYPDDVTFEQARSVVMKERPELFPDAPSGFWAGAEAGTKRAIGTLGAMPDLALGALLGDEERYKEGIKSLEETERWASDANPNPVGIDDVRKAWEEEGLIGSLDEGWDAAKNFMGESLPYMATMATANRIGGTKAFASLASKRFPSLRTGAQGNVTNRTRKNLAHTLGAGSMIPIHFGQNLSRQVESGAASPEDMNVWTALAAAPVQAALEYVFVALMDPSRGAVRQAAAQSISQFLKHQAIDASSEIPTEMAQTILERAQDPNLSISLSDAENVKEVVYAGIAGGVAGAGYGAASTAAQYSGVRKAQEAYQENLKGEEEIRGLINEKVDQNLRREQELIASGNEEELRMQRVGIDLSTVDQEALEEALARVAGRPVTEQDIHDVANGRNINWDNDPGFMAFSKRVTTERDAEGNVIVPGESHIDRMNDDQRRTLYEAVLKFSKQGERVSLPAFIDSEYEAVLNAHRSQRKKPATKDRAEVAKKPAKNLTVDSIRKVLGLTNSAEDKAVARQIRNEAIKREDAVRKDKKLIPVNKPYSGGQYRKILELSRNRVDKATGKPAPMVTRDIIESVTGRTDILFANRIRNDMVSRKDLEQRGTQYFPITLSSILEKRQASSVPGKGFFIRNEKGRIIGGRRKVRDARTLAKAMEENNTEYLLYQDGELVNTYKKPLNKKDPRATARKAKTRALRAVPGSTVEIVESSPKYTVSSVAEAGVEVLETGTDLRGDTFQETIDFVKSQAEANRKQEQLNKDRIGSLPYEERIESLVGEEIKEATPRVINRRLIKGETLEEEISWREQLAAGVKEALSGFGLGGISLQLENKIKGSEGMNIEGFHNQGLGRITLALDRIDTSRPMEDQIATLVDVVNHELVHDVRSLDLFTEQEWNVLKDYVDNKVIPGDPNGATFLEVARVAYSDKTLDEQYEEAIAQAFRYYMKTGKGVAGKPRSLMDRFKNFLTKFLNFLSINEFHSADEVFAAIQEGEIAGRESVIDGKPVIRTIKDIDSPFWQKKLSQLRSKKEDSEQKNRDTSNKITLISGGTEREELPPDRESREVRQLEPSIPEGVSEEEFFEEMPISELVKYSRNPVEWNWEEVQHFNTKENADVGDLMNVYLSTAFVPVKGHDDLKLQVGLYTYMADHGRAMVGREGVLRGKTFASVMFDVYGAGRDSMDPAMVKGDGGELVLASSIDRSFPFKVIATVIDTMQDYVAQEQPDFISFSPATESLRDFYSSKLGALAEAISFEDDARARGMRRYYPAINNNVPAESYFSDGRRFGGAEARQAFDVETEYFGGPFLLRGADIEVSQQLFPVKESRAADRALNMPLHESLPSDIRSRISPSRYREATKLGYPDTDSFIRSVMDKRTKDTFVSDNGEDFNDLLSRVFWSEGDPAKKDVNDYVLGYTDRSGVFWDQDETNAIDEAYYAGRFPINTSELDKQSRFNPKPEEFQTLIPDSQREPVDVVSTLNYVRSMWNVLTSPFNTQAPGPGSALIAKYAGTPGVLNKIIYGDPNTGKGGFLWNSYRKLEALGYKPEEYLARREIRIVPPSLDFINNAFRQPEAARFWYELSGIFFGGTGLSRGYKQRFINLVAATSAQAKPGDNFAKAVAIIAEDMRNLTPSDSELGSVGSPILTGVISAGSVRRALADNEVNGLKFENFAGTLQRMAGVNGDKHIPVIDTMMARVFGINEGDINGTTYFLLADWITQLTALENQAISQMPDRDTIPYNPWQLQAMMWVHHRIVEDGASGPEDYALVLQELIGRLVKNNFPGNVPANASDIDEAFLRQPRLTASLQPARERYRLHTQIATVETGGGLHKENARASQIVADLMERYRSLGDSKEDLALKKKIRGSIDEYHSILKSTMQEISKKSGKGAARKPSVLEDLLTSIVGTDLNLSRVTRDSFGTWDLAVSPNIRIPLTATRSGGRPVRLTSMQRRQFASVLGIELGQEAMGNTQFVLLDDQESLADAKWKVENESPVSIPGEVPNREFSEQTSIWVHGVKPKEALWLTNDLVDAVGDKFKDQDGDTVGGFVAEQTPTGVLLHLVPGEYVNNINIAEIEQEIRNLLPENHIDSFRVMAVMETDAHGNPDFLQEPEYKEFDPSLEEIVEGTSGTARDTARKNDLLRDVKERIRRAYEEQAKALEAWENDVRNGKKTKSGKASESIMSQLGMNAPVVDPADGKAASDSPTMESRYVDPQSIDYAQFNEALENTGLGQRVGFVPVEDNIDRDAAVFRGKSDENKGQSLVGIPVQDGLRVDVRLNLNAKRDNHGLVQTIHRVKSEAPSSIGTGTVISYKPIVMLRNVTFPVYQPTREKIKERVVNEKGETFTKTPHATARGDYVDIPVEDMDFSGIEVGYNPFKGHLFRELDNSYGIKSADEAIVVGNRVFARGNIEYFSEEEGEALRTGDSDSDVYYEPSVIDEILPSNKHSRVGAIPRINVDASPRAQQIASGEVEGEKLSRNEWKEFELGLNKYSMDGIPADVEQRTANVISSPKNVTMFSLMNAVLEQDWKKLATTLRAMFVDKYTRIVQIRDQALEIRKRMGMDVERWMLADLDASAATYRAERAAGLLQSAIMRGIPFFARTEATDANGNVIATGGRHTVKDLEIEVMDANGNITMSTGGFYQIMRPLYQNMTGKQILDIWAKYRMAKRELRFENENRKLPGEQQMDPADRQYWIDAIENPKTASDKNVAEVVKMVNRNFDKWNGGFVQYLVDTGVLTPEAGEIYTAHNDYIPFYRQWNDESTSAEDQMIESVMSGVHQGRPGMPKALFGSITGIKTGHRAKGGKKPIVDPMTSILQNSLAAISNGMKNDAAQKVMRDGLLIGDDLVQRLEDKHYDPALVDYVHEVRENGEVVYYNVKDPLLHSALEGFTEGKLPGLALIAKPAAFLREMVTRSPDFIVANLLRDTVSAWTTSGSSHMPFIETLKHMSGNMMNPQASESFQALDRDGLSTGFDLSQRIEGKAGEILKRYKREGVDIGEKDSAWDDVMRVWDWFGDVTTKSDMATRQAVYEDVLKRMRSQGYDTNVAEAEAVFQAMEVINFSRRGNSSPARYLTAAIPFLNARIQGLDVLYRAGMGKYSSDQSKVAQNIARMAFVKRMGFLAAASIIYWMYVHDDDEYRDARPEVRQDNIILPRFGGWLGKVVPNKIPKPFEVGLIAWTIPEIFAEMISGNQDQRQAVNALKRGLETTLAFNPIPQAIKPAFEAYNNLSYFTGREIVPYFQGDQPAQLQHRPGTNVLAMALGEMFNESPSKIEHILRGYTGTIGSYVLFAADSAIRPHTNYPSTPELRLDQYPMLRRFFQSDLGGGQLAEFYEFREASEEVTNGISALRGEHRHKEANRIVNENMGIIRTQSRRKGMDRVLANLRSHRMRILLDRRMGDAEKARQLRAIQEREKAVLHDLGATRERADLPVDLPFPLSVFERG